MSVNQITLIGNMGKDMKVVGQDSNPVCNFSVCTNYEYKNKAGEKVSEAEWTRVVAFGQTAKYISSYAEMGRQVYVQGRLRTRSYEKEGVKHYVTEVVAETVQLLGGKQGERAERQAPAQQAPQAAPQAQQAAQMNEMDDDIPF